MSEVKIAVSEKTNELIQEIGDDIGIKRSEFVKSLVIGSLKGIRARRKNGK